jgi:hypothetical protein
MDAGLKLAVKPAGKPLAPDTLNATLPLKPFTAAVVAV